MKSEWRTAKNRVGGDKLPANPKTKPDLIAHQSQSGIGENTA